MATTKESIFKKFEKLREKVSSFPVDKKISFHEKILEKTLADRVKLEDIV